MKSFNASLSSLIFLLQLALLPSLFPSSIPSSGDPSLIEETCQRTPYPDLCVSVLMCNPNSSGADVGGLAGMVIDSALLNATATLDFVRAMINKTTDPATERPLDYCAELYIPVVKYTLPQGKEAFDRGQYRFAEYCLSNAAKQAGACEKMFSGSVANPMGDRNWMFQQLCSVAMAIVEILMNDW